MPEHPDREVQAALVRLNDALCTWERSTGRRSILILREEGGYMHRSDSGKPTIPDDIDDEFLLQQVKER
jgi:hypothetical protein